MTELRRIIGVGLGTLAAAGGALVAQAAENGRSSPQHGAVVAPVAVAVPRHAIRTGRGRRAELAPGVELEDADLRHAHWRGADLQRVVLTHVDLRGADLT